MLKKIMHFNAGWGNFEQSVTLGSFSPDHIYFSVDGLYNNFGSVDESIPNPSTDAEKVALYEKYHSDSFLGFDYYGSGYRKSVLNKIKVNAYLKNADGKDITLVNNVPLHDLLMLSDYSGNSDYSDALVFDYLKYLTFGNAKALVSESEADKIRDRVHYGILSDVMPRFSISLNLGKVILTGDDKLTLSITGSLPVPRIFKEVDVTVGSEKKKGYVIVGADSDDSGFTGVPFVFDVFADDSLKSSEVLLTYNHVKGLDSQRFNFKNSYDLYGIGETDSTLYVHDAFGENPVTVSGELCKARCVGMQGALGGYFGAGISTAYPDYPPFASLWHDNTGWSQDISFTTVNEMDFLVVGESFHPERAGKEEKDVRDFAGYYASIETADADKWAVLQARK